MNSPSAKYVGKWMKWAAAAVVSGVSLLGVSQAHAGVTCHGIGPGDISFNANLSKVDPRLPVGSAIGSWQTATSGGIWWSCIKNSTPDSIVNMNMGVLFRPIAGLKDAGITVMHGKSTYTVFETGHPGLGIAVGVHPLVPGCTDSAVSYWDLGGKSGGTKVPNSTGWKTGSICRTSRNTGGEVYVLFVKTGAIRTGQVARRTIAQIGGLLLDDGVRPIKTLYSPDSLPKVTVSITATPITLTGCNVTVPNLAVPMGAQSASSMASVGSTGKATPFTLNFTNCPAGLTKLSYQLNAPGKVLDAAKGIVNLSDGSTASGVAVKLMTSSGGTLVLDTDQTIASYNSSVGGNVAVNLQAAYYRTGTIKAGSANAVVTFTLGYL